MPKIEKHGNLYRVRVSTGERLPSGSYRSVALSAPTEKELRKLMVKYEEDLHQAAYEQRTGDITLRKAIDEYIDTCRAARRSPSTIRGYLSIRDTAFGSLGDKRIRSITKRDLQMLINRWASDGNSAKTIANKFGLLASALSHADRPINTNSLTFPERERKEMTIPEDEDIQRALFYLRANDPDMYIAVVLASTLGLRRGEICALTIDDFDFSTDTVIIKKSKVMDENKNWVVKSPKTKSGYRRLRLPTLVKSAVQNHTTKDGFLIHFSPNALTERYHKIGVNLCIPGRFHDLRHYKASVMAALDVPTKYAQEIMGHATPDMLNRVYQHTMRKMRDAVGDILADHDNIIMSGNDYDYNFSPKISTKK